MTHAATTIMVFGTFDMLHPGHLDFFKQARSLSRDAYLIVSIARDVNVIKIKGKAPRHNEHQRMHVIAACPLVDEVLLGSIDDYIRHIVDVNPDVIALGYDQVAYTDTLSEKLKRAGIMPQIIRLKAFRPETYKTSLLRKVPIKSDNGKHKPISIHPG